MHFKLTLAFGFFLVLPVYAQDAVPPTEPKAIEDFRTCNIEPPTGASWAEHLVWQEVCTRGRSDLSDHINGVCASENASNVLPTDNDDLHNWNLSEDFLTTILTSSIYVAARKTPDVELRCMRIPRLDLGSHKVQGSLRIEDSVIGSVDLRNARIDGTLDFDNSIFTSSIDAFGLNVWRNLRALGALFEDDVWLDDATIGGFLDMDDAIGRGKINAPGIRVSNTIYLRNAVFDEVNLQGARIGGDLNAEGATLKGLFDAERIRAEGAVFLRGGATFEEVSLQSAKIDSNVEATGSTFTGLFDAQSIRTGGDIHLRGRATFNDVRLSGAEIGGSLDAEASTFKGLFNASRLSANGHLSMQEATFNEVQMYGTQIGGNLAVGGSTFNDVHLNGSRIGGLLTASGSTFLGFFEAERLRVDGSIIFREGSSFADLDLTATTIGQHLQLQGSRYNGTVDLSELSVGSLLLWRGGSSDGAAPAQDAVWGPDATLILRNAQSNSLQARMGGPDETRDSWTRQNGVRLPTDLTGFRYEQLGGITSGVQHDLARIDSKPLIHWVDTSALPEMMGYRPQPYLALESALSGMGAEAAAKEVAYARLRHRTATRVSANWWTEFETWVGQILTSVFDRFLQFTVGFGLYPQRAFYWFLGLVVVGTFLARPSQSLRKQSASRATWGDSFFYSLENAIPLMEPSTDYAKVEHDKFGVRMFFNAQKVLGFVLASVLIGALTLGG